MQYYANTVSSKLLNESVDPSLWGFSASSTRSYEERVSHRNEPKPPSTDWIINRYFSCREKLDNSKKSLSLWKNWVFLHHSDVGFLGVIAKFFSWASRSLQHELTQLKSMELHVATYQHLAHIKCSNLQVPDTQYAPFFDASLTHTKKSWCEVIQRVVNAGSILKDVDTAFCSDREVVFLAVKSHGLALRFASQLLRNDKDIVLTALNQNTAAYQHIGESLKMDQDVLCMVESAWLF